jgi:WD repeat-containing protein 45
MDLTAGSTNELLYVGFNQDASKSSTSVRLGGASPALHHRLLRLRNSHRFSHLQLQPVQGNVPERYGAFSGSSPPFALRACRADFMKGGIGRVEMLFRCNILALVGGGPSPRYPPEKVMIWDDHQNRCIGELSFRSEVRNVRLRRDRIVVVLRRKVYVSLLLRLCCGCDVVAQVYNFADLSRLNAIETADNPAGLCALSTDPGHRVLACPAMQRGKVRVELYDTRQTIFISAHESDIACLQLNNTGSRLATASSKGTLVRIFDTTTGALLQEVRRGTDHTTIYCLAFNEGSTMLALTSEKGTCHIFKLTDLVHDKRGSSVSAGMTDDEDEGAGLGASEGPTATDAAAGAVAEESTDSAAAASASSATAAGPTDGSPVMGTADPSRAKGRESATAAATAGIGGMLAGVLPRFMVDDRSFAQFRTDAKRSICAFGAEPNTVIIVTETGQYLKASFEKGGEAERSAYAPFIKPVRA